MNHQLSSLRSFGFAGKLFPTLDPNELLKVHTANFFLIDDLGGTTANHYTDVAMNFVTNSDNNLNRVEF